MESTLWLGNLVCICSIALLFMLLFTPFFVFLSGSLPSLPSAAVCSDAARSFNSLNSSCMAASFAMLAPGIAGFTLSPRMVTPMPDHLVNTSTSPSLWLSDTIVSAETSIVPCSTIFRVSSGA